MENSWLNYLAKRFFEDASIGNLTQLDKNDPIVKQLLANPDIISSFTKNPQNAVRNKERARNIIQKAITTNKSLPLVAKASDIANKAGLN